MTSGLSERQLGLYQREGIVFPIRVITSARANGLRRTLESLSASGSEKPQKRLDNLHLFFDWAYELVTSEALLNAVEGILGDDLLIDGSLVFSKPPHDPGYVTWHQDSVYSGWHLSPSTSAWIALTDSAPDNGCMRVIPGTHTQGLMDHANVRDSANMLKRGESVRMEVDESQAVDVVLKPGEMSLHNSNIVHGSNKNTSDDPRIGFIVRFVTPQTRNSERPLLRVRGNADCRHLRIAEAPSEKDPQNAVSAWRASTRSSETGTWSG